jgi:pyruvate/2-oxoglutarate dehydrogenase complex dihydrolipoamide dehydrogenase (E3) component
MDDGQRRQANSLNRAEIHRRSLSKYRLPAEQECHSHSETRGFMKVIIDAHSDRILGFAPLGPEAGELMSNVQIAMLAGQPYTLL